MSMRLLQNLLLAAALPLCSQAPDLAQVRPADLEVLPLDQLSRRGLEHHQAGRLAQAMQDWMELTGSTNLRILSQTILMTYLQKS